MTLRLTRRGRVSVAVLALTVAGSFVALAGTRPEALTVAASGLSHATDALTGEAPAGSAVSAAAEPWTVLRKGDRGEEVLAVERRLAVLRFDIGRVDGTFDDDTAHAVTALQKVTGLPPTGVVDDATHERALAPVQVALRHPATGRAFEVDLTKQVMYLSQAGRLVRVYDVSTGSNEMILVSGKPERAVTPLGTYRIQRKINGIRYAPLGELYRPAYFIEGWAVHGSPDVRPFPVSHGCVRVTDAAQDRLWPLLSVGTPISLYGAWRA